MPTESMNRRYPGEREEWVDDSGSRIVGVHPENDGCRTHGCALHNPSEHEYSDYPLIWSPARAMFVRKIRDAEYVADPDELAFRERMAARGIEGPLWKGAESAL